MAELIMSAILTWVQIFRKKCRSTEMSINRNVDQQNIAGP